MQRKGFTLIELLIVISIIILLLSILLPCLIGAKERAFELFAMQTEADKEGKVLLELRDPSNIASYEGIYMIEINPPRNCQVYLKKPYRPGMKLIKRDGQDYIKWRPTLNDIGIHPVTVVFEGEETSEKELTIYVFNKKLLEAKQGDK